MKLFEILIPCTFDGEKIKKSYHKKWDNFVRELVGGLTIMKPAKGIWVYNGMTFDEKMIPVRIACTDKDIMKIINFTANYYNQNAIMAYQLSENVVIKEF